MANQLELRYPSAPGYKKRDTSEQAAKEIAATDSHAKGQRIIFELICRHGPMTADEIAALLGKDRLYVRPRCSELARKEILVDSGVRRRNESGKLAIVWDRNLAYPPRYFLEGFNDE